MKAPKEIVTYFKKIWLDRVKHRNPHILFEDDYIKNDDIELLERAVADDINDNPFTTMLKELSEVVSKPSNFWAEVLSGNYNLFYHTFHSHIKIEQEGETFVI